MNKVVMTVSFSILFCAGCAPTTSRPPAPATIASPAATTPQAAKPVKKAVVRQKPLASVQVYPGSLKENIERIAGHYGWHQVVWDAPEDYRWVGKATVSGASLSRILNQLLADYPLQAVFYQGNHVLYIHPRTLK